TCAPARFLMPVMRFRVVCGRGDTIESFSPTRRFKSVDFPALGRPMSDTKPARLVIVAGSVRAVPTEGGLRQLRPGSASRVSFVARSAWTEGGLRQLRPGSASRVSFVARSAWTEGGLRQLRPGSESRVSFFASRRGPRVARARHGRRRFQESLPEPRG